MRRLCAWCGRFLGHAEPINDPRVTHGLCPECAAKMRAELETLQKKED